MLECKRNKKEGIRHSYVPSRFDTLLQHINETSERNILTNDLKSKGDSVKEAQKKCKDFLELFSMDRKNTGIIPTSRILKKYYQIKEEG